MERFFNVPFVFLFRHNAGRKYFLTKEKLIIIFYLMNIVSSSLLNNVVQRGIRFSTYCPKMEHCTEGTHVMCTYYNPSAVMGPNCGQGQNITVTPELIELILGVVNQIRATVAKGEETGKDGVRLPKAYGMARLRWDKELATFAQIWANQCTIQHDLCRATKRFPNPAQLVSLVRFTYPDWRLINDNSSLSNKNEGLTTSKLKHTITTTMKISYFQKNQVTREMVERFPDLTKSPHLASIRVFMTMIHTGSTHMGCGISAYADYYGTSSQSVIVNNVQVVCNFSGQPKAGSSVIAIQRAPGTSLRCGCPPDTFEDEDCLCVPRYRDPDEEIRSCSRFDLGCTSSGILPVMMTDAPTVIPYQSRLGNESFFRRSAIHTNYHSRGNNFFDGQLRGQLLKLSNGKLPKSNKESHKRIGYRARVNDVKNRYFDTQLAISGQRYQTGGSLIREGAHVLPNRNPPASRRNSIFTRVSNFKLPFQNKHVDHGVFQSNYTIKKRTTIKKDVKPRKDFSNLQDIVTAYLNKRHSNHSSIRHPVDHLINSIDANTPKFGIAGFNRNLSKKHFEIKNEETDNKLLTLLDNLEEEVKHIELNGDIKEIVDERIRKIYGDVVGDRNLLKTKDTRVVDDLIKHVEKKTENKALRLQTRTGIPEVEFALPTRRRQNSMSRYDNTIQEQNRDKQRIFERNDREYNNKQYRSNNRRRYKQDFANKNDFLSDDEDLLGVERRRFYQDKLDNIERKLKSIRGYKRGEPKPDKGHFFRPVMKSHPTLDDLRFNNRMKNFYVPDRAKFLHGF